MLMTDLTEAKLRVARAKQPQLATYDDFPATQGATEAQPGSLKALAGAVLARNSERNSCAIEPGNGRNSSTENTHEKLRLNSGRNQEVTTSSESCALRLPRVRNPQLINLDYQASEIAEENGLTPDQCLSILDDDDRQAIVAGGDPFRLDAWRASVELLVKHGKWRAHELTD